MQNLDPIKIHLLTTKSKVHYTDHTFYPGDFLLFGSETKGIDASYLKKYYDRCCTIPMHNKNIRSLNLSNSVSIVLYEALRQTNQL